MIKRKVLRGLTATSLALLAVTMLGSTNIVSKKKDILDGEPIHVTAFDNSDKRVDYSIPTYNSLKLPPNNCARYVTMAAHDVFGLNYIRGNAWDLRYDNRIVSSVEKGNLERLASEKTIQPGMTVGIFNPSSRYLKSPDKNGNQKKYTHVVLYLGRDSHGEPLLAHQYGVRVRVETYGSLRKKGLEAREILAPKKIINP